MDDKYVHIIMFKSLDIKKMKIKSIVCYHYTMCYHICTMAKIFKKNKTKCY